MKHVESLHQVALVEWACRTRIPAAPDVEPGSTVADYLFAVPNGGKRNPREAARMKAEGVKAGVSDLILPLQRQGRAGLFLELKAPGNKPTAQQSAWLARMARAGYAAEWCDDWISAARLIARFLGIPEPLNRIMEQH